jgi:hypothetical protein
MTHAGKYNRRDQLLSLKGQKGQRRKSGDVLVPMRLHLMVTIMMLLRVLRIWQTETVSYKQHSPNAYGKRSEKKAKVFVRILMNALQALPMQIRFAR